MTTQELQDLVNYRRRDVTESFISNDEVLAYLKEANRKVTSNYEFDWNKVSATIAYTKGSIRYALSAVASDMDDPINLFYTPAQDFSIVKPEDFMRLSAHNYDMMAVDGNYMLLNTSFGSGNLTLNYYTTNTAQTSAGSLITNLSASTDEPLMPELHQDILVDFAAARCYQKEGMTDDFAIAYKDYQTGLKNLIAKIPSRKRHYNTIFKNTRKAFTLGGADKSDPLNSY